MSESSIYTVGGTVQAGDGIYIRRKADDELLALCRSSTFAYVLTPRQLGKSSLMESTAEQLKAEGVATVTIDLSQMGSQLDPKQAIFFWFRCNGVGNFVLTELPCSSRLAG
jgi:hypothetical protein